MITVSQALTACTSPGDNQLQCFVRGSNNRLYRRVWNGIQWTIWEDMGVNATSAPTVASWGPNRISLFARGDNGNLLHRYWDGSRWIGWEDLGGNIASSPACVSWGANSLDCFARDVDPVFNTDQGLIRRSWRG